MISDEDTLRLEEAKHCQGCPGWLKHCKSECCKLVKINIDPHKIPKTGNYLTIHQQRLSPGDRWYYSLRGVKTDRNLLRFPLNNIVVLGQEVMYVRECDMLTKEGLCEGHPDKKPSVCKELTLATVDAHLQAVDGIYVTRNCLFRYKQKEE